MEDKSEAGIEGAGGSAHSGNHYHGRGTHARRRDSTQMLRLSAHFLLTKVPATLM